MTAHAQPPEARVIREKREAKIPALSMKRAAAAAAADGLGPFSPALWTLIENGYQQTAQGPVPYRGTADRIARMARVVGASPRELERAGRADAAGVLKRLPVVAPGAARESLSKRVERLERLLADQLAAEDEEGDRARRRA